MNSENYLLLLYGYYPSMVSEEGSYRLMNVVDERGLVDDHSLKSALSSSLGRDFESSADIFFKSLDELNKFSYSLMDDLDAPFVCILSVENYNTCLEKSASLAEFKELLLEASNCLENIDYTKDKSLLSKIFN
jgi:hypothetical protein